MNWGPPPSHWKEIDGSEYVHYISNIDYRRTAFGDCIVYEDKWRGGYIGAIQEKPKPDRYFINPDYNYVKA